MATTKSQTLNANSVDILNAIRNDGTAQYQALVPQADGSIQNIRAIGDTLVSNGALANEFISSLVNRIGMVVITNKEYTNPWAMFKQGTLEFGEVIEQIFVDIAKVHQYDVVKSESEVWKREIPDVNTVFHILNYQKFYKATIQDEDLKLAFTSMDGVTDLIAKIVDAMYTASENDEFLVMKYTLAQAILNGRLFPVTVPTVSDDNAKAIVRVIKSVSNDMTFLKNKYTFAGVHNQTRKEDQYLIVNSNFESQMNVDVLASAFNMDKAEFAGHVVLVDSFGEIDSERMQELLGDDPNYSEITTAQKTALNSVPAVIVDRDYFQVYDKLRRFTEDYNGQGLYWNYWYHVWKIFSTSPFSPTAVFVPGTPSVTSVTVSPTSVTAPAGSVVMLSAVVATEYFASQAVEWSISTGGGTVNNAGVVHLAGDLAKDSTVTVTATSRYDTTKSATVTITIE